MKITKRQLKRIIREEKQKLLRESQDQESALLDALDEFVMVVDEEMGVGGQRIPTDFLGLLGRTIENDDTRLEITLLCKQQKLLLKKVQPLNL